MFLQCGGDWSLAQIHKGSLRIAPAPPHLSKWVRVMILATTTAAMKALRFDGMDRACNGAQPGIQANPCDEVPLSEIPLATETDRPWVMRKWNGYR